MIRRLIAASGTGVAWLVEAEVLGAPPELVLVLAEFVRAVAGDVEASVCTVEVSADVVLEDESELLMTVVLESGWVGEEASGELDEGVSVPCEPVAIADVRPETLCAWAETPFDSWI